MEGFFYKEEQKKTKNRKKLTGRKTSAKRQVKEYTCRECGLYNKCNSPRMEPTGEGELKILIVGEAPGKEEDKKGIQFVGASGQILRQAIKELDLDLKKHFWKTNALCCRPPGNRDPKNIELLACRKRLLDTIEKFNPEKIILLGKYAYESLLGYKMTGRIKDVSFSDFVGTIIPDQTIEKYICVLNHPAYCLYANRKKDNSVEKIWKGQLKKAIESDQKFYKHNYEKDSIPYLSLDSTLDLLRRFRKECDILAIDYETTGKKPYKAGHKILTASISDGILGYGFPFFEDDEFRRLWKSILTDPNIKKIIQSAKFEQIWSREILGYYIQNVYWDTCLAGHSIHNKRPTSLKYQVYVEFGVLGYDSKVDSYITRCKQGEDKKSANSLNRLDEAPLQDVLFYGGLDAFFTFKLYEMQQNRLNKNQKRGYELFMDSIIPFAETEINGICIDEELIEIKEKYLIRKLERIKSQILESEEVSKWDGDDEFNFNSHPQLSHLLFDILGIKSKGLTKSMKPSTDKTVLEKIDIPFVKGILEYKRWSKAKGTYLAQYKREAVKGIVHPSLNLNSISTYRSSANNPNIQNTPNRDEQVKEMIRCIIRARPGNKLKGYDYKGIEVAVAACYTKDPMLIRYVTDSKTDMHRDMACQIFFRNKNTFTKQERFYAKNRFVFPSFYGSYYEQTAPDLWEGAILQPDTYQNLIENGIEEYEDFEQHIKEIEYDFWNNRFAVYNEWKKKTWKEYQKKGYIDSLTGFRYYGVMKRNEVLNYRIQGSAFHCLLWTYNKIYPKMKRFENTFLIGEIHDEILADVYPQEEERLDYLIWLWGTQKIREYWDWIVVPLSIEHEASEVNGNWASMQESGYLKF